MNIVITGAGGFIGGHLAARLVADGHSVVGVSRSPLDKWWQTPGMGFRCDLTKPTSDIAEMIECADEVYHLACDMGGRGFTGSHDWECAQNVALDLAVFNMVRWSKARVFYASTACVYPNSIQDAEHSPPLSEPMAGPPYDPDGMYGAAKLYGEQVALTLARTFGTRVRIGRFHGVFGEHGDWTGGREKATAAISRKVARAIRNGQREIEIWGDGTQERPFLHVAEAVEGMIRVMRSEYDLPVNIGAGTSYDMMTVARMICEVAGAPSLKIKTTPGPVGPLSRSCDNTLLREVTGWEPTMPLKDGLALAYRWIAEQVNQTPDAETKTVA